MTSPRDYYAVLGIRRSASEEEIKGAFRRMSMAYHPDLNKSPGAAERMREINAAHDTLSDPAKRAEYDQALDRAEYERERRQEYPPPPRRGDDIVLDAIVTADDALYDTEVDVFLNGRWLRVDIPAGIRDGATIRLSGQGAPGVNGGRPGDAFLQIRVEPPSPHVAAPEPDRKRSDSGGCGCGAAAIVAIVAVILLWIASGC